MLDCEDDMSEALDYMILGLGLTLDKYNIFWLQKIKVFKKNTNIICALWKYLEIFSVLETYKQLVQ